MTPDIVVDVGNSRMKWGLCAPDVVEMVSLPLDDLNAWDDQAERWWTEGPTNWAVGGVNPKRIEQFLKWQRTRRGNARHFTRYDQLPIKLAVDAPEAVGLDRLFGCVAANAVRDSGRAAVTIDVGTAVTVNVIDPDGVFRGGAIFPGFRLMANALHTHTAKLPEVTATAAPAPFPGTNTADAIHTGIRFAVVGGVLRACEEVGKQFGRAGGVDAFVTGGGSSPDLFTAPGWTFLHVPRLNLEGIRLAAKRV
jgi:type III pantothenate kinase